MAPVRLEPRQTANVDRAPEPTGLELLANDVERQDDAGSQVFAVSSRIGTAKDRVEAVTAVEDAVERLDE